MTRPVVAHLRRLGWPLLLVAVAAACSSGGAEPDVPEDFVTTEGEGFAISHPGGWEVLDQGATEIRVAAPGTEGTRPAVTVSVDQAYRSGADGFDTAVDGTLTVLDNVRQDVEQVAEEDPAIPGADRARLVESTFATAGEGVRVRHVDLFVVDGDGRLFYARAEGPEGEVDSATLRSIVTSLRIG